MRLKKWRDDLLKEVDNSQLILFRIIYGLLLTLEAWGAILTGWVRRVFIEPQLNFPFIDFDFLEPLGGNGMLYYYFVMGVMGVGIMIGFRFRLAMIVYTIMWAGVYFMQKTSYNNHYYLITVFNFIFCFLPAHQYASIDSKNNRFKSLTCPLWSIWIFKAMILVVYFYSSVAKMYPEWLDAIPIKIWFTAKSDYWLVGPLLEKEWFQYFVAWGGVIFDLLIGPALLWRKTRKFAFLASIFFHLFNSVVFQVGIFPYLGISFGLFFFERDTIRRIFFKSKPSAMEIEVRSKQQPGFIPLILAVLLIIQLILPIRHWYFPGDVNWTEEGHRLSWHMMLRVKSGYVSLTVKDNLNEKTETVNLDNYLTKKQQRAIATRPDMLWQFVQHLKKEYLKRGKNNISIHVQGRVSLNGSDPKPLYDPDFDMADAKWEALKTSQWVLKYENRNL